MLCRTCREPYVYTFSMLLYYIVHTRKAFNYRHLSWIAYLHVSKEKHSKKRLKHPSLHAVLYPCMFIYEPASTRDTYLCKVTSWILTFFIGVITTRIQHIPMERYLLPSSHVDTVNIVQVYYTL